MKLFILIYLAALLAFAVMVFDATHTNYTAEQERRLAQENKVSKWAFLTPPREKK